VLFDGIQLEVLNIIKAHKTGITNIAFDPRGELLATSSVRGTLVRVFEVGEGSKFRSRDGRVETSEHDGYAFRRGSTAAVISSLCFSPDSQTLCCATTSGYAYLFAHSNLVFVDLALASARTSQACWLTCGSPSEHSQPFRFLMGARSLASRPPTTICT